MEEGYVKYHAEHSEAPAVEPPGWAELNKARTRLRDLGLIGMYPNGVGYGNVSIRVTGDEFLITGTATGDGATLSPAQYCLVKSFDIAKNTVQTQGPVNASSESMSHGAVYRACPHVNCVIHIHNRRIFDGLLKDKAPATPADAAFGTPEMARAIFDLVKQGGAQSGYIVMTGHDEGVILYAESVAKALDLTLKLFNNYVES